MSMPRPRPTQTPAFRVEKSDPEWRETLSAEQYRVLRRQGTERAFTSALNQETRPGRFCCAGCGAPLFRMAISSTQAPAGQVSQPEEDAAVGTQTDRSLFMTRRTSAACGGHLGHRFPDGPAQWPALLYQRCRLLLSQKRALVE